MRPFFLLSYRWADLQQLLETVLTPSIGRGLELCVD